MHRSRTSRARRIAEAGAALGAIVLFATACGGDPAPDGPVSGKGRPTGAAATGTSAPSPAASGPEPTSCPGGGQLIEAVEIPAVRADPVHIPEATIGGQKIAAVTVPGVDIPAQRVPAQCVDVKPAPGGCLSAVSIPGTSIPGTRIPGVEIPGVDAGGVKLAPVRTPAVTTPPVSAPAVATGEVCQAKPHQEGVHAPLVWRPMIWRPMIWRPMIWRPMIWRPQGCNKADECVPEVKVPEVRVEEVKVPEVKVAEAVLQEYTSGRSKVLKGGDRIAYNVEADVLFDFGRAEVKPAAAAELAKIAAAVRKDVPADAPVQVDGHTDAKGDPAANQRLSEQRAQAIVEWLVAKGGIERSRLKAAGYGESKPAAANTRPDGSDDPQARAKNRRVVISARPK
ncbi:OmpA family protein [Spirillospora sp. NPDC127200]